MVALCTLACFAGLGLVVVLAINAGMTEDASENEQPQPPPTTRVQQPDANSSPTNNRQPKPRESNPPQSSNPSTSSNSNNAPATEDDPVDSSIGPRVEPNAANRTEDANSSIPESNDPPEEEPLIPDDEKTPDLPENFPDAEGTLPRPGES